MKTGDFTIIERKTTADELNDLRDTVGWGRRDSDATQKGLEGTLYGVCAMQGDQLIGTARVVGDGATVFYIQDVIVLEEYQGRGIGRAMMAKAMGYIATNACAGAVVGLMAAKGKEPFYEKFGFWARPTEKHGAGMIQFWKAK